MLLRAPLAPPQSPCGEQPRPALLFEDKNVNCFWLAYTRILSISGTYPALCLPLAPTPRSEPPTLSSRLQHICSPICTKSFCGLSMCVRRSPTDQLRINHCFGRSSAHRIRLVVSRTHSQAPEAPHLLPPNRMRSCLIIWPNGAQPTATRHKQFVDFWKKFRSRMHGRRLVGCSVVKS